MIGENHSMNTLFTFLIVLCACSAFGQKRQLPPSDLSGWALPGLQFVEPDLDSGRPSALKSAVDSSWQVPLMVYEDINVAMYTTKLDVVAEVQAGGFASSGRYAVVLYSFYKNDVLCNEQLRSDPQIVARLKKEPSLSSEITDDCHSMRYKRRILEVDTHSQTMKSIQVVAVDEYGHHLMQLKDDGEWLPIARCDKGLRGSISHLTATIEREDHSGRWR
jgi:hypothetical protein